MGVAFSPSGEFFASVGADEQVQHIYLFLQAVLVHI